MTHPRRSIFNERAVKAGEARVRITGVRLDTHRRSTSGRSSAAPKSKEIVVRVLNKAKHPAGAGAIARYIGRVQGDEHRQNPDLPAAARLETDDGRVLTTRREIDAEIKSWNLAAPEDNRSAAWKRASPDERRQMDETWREASPEWRRANPKADPFHRVQSAHIIVSVPTGDENQMRESVRQAAHEQFPGYRYVYAIHTDHGRGPHAHILVKAQGEETGHALPLRKNDLASMRETFARSARDHGIDVVATRRMDRKGDEIAQGIEPIAQHDRTRGKWTAGDTLRSKAPRWHESYGPDAAARSAGIEEPAPKKKGYFGNFVKPAEEKSEAFRETRGAFGHYKDPTAATKSYVALYAENPRLAQWAYTHNPHAFGSATGPAPAKAPDGKTAAKASRDLADKLYPTVAPERKAGLAAATDAARADRRRDRGREAVGRSYDALSRAAREAGDHAGAEDISRRAEAARHGRPLPPVRPLPTRHQQQDPPMPKPEDRLHRFNTAAQTVADLKRQNDANFSPETAKALVAAQKELRASANAITRDPEALSLAKQTGMDAQIQAHVFGAGRGRGLSL